MLVAREEPTMWCKKGKLVLFDLAYPVRNESSGTWDTSTGDPNDKFEIDEDYFPELTWNDEPIEVQLLRA